MAPLCPSRDSAQFAGINGLRSLMGTHFVTKTRFSGILLFFVLFALLHLCQVEGARSRAGNEQRSLSVWCMVSERVWHFVRVCSLFGVTCRVSIYLLGVCIPVGCLYTCWVSVYL